MSPPSRVVRDLARQVLEASRSAPPRHGAATPPAHETVLVCETLRKSVARFAGADGFEALLRRAVALARNEVPGLARVRIGADGAWDEEALRDLAAGGRATEAAVAVAANLLALLVTFIGEPLTLQLVREACPGADLDLRSGMNRGSE